MAQESSNPALLSRLENMNTGTAMLGALAIAFAYGTAVRVTQNRFRIREPWPTLFSLAAGGTMAWIGTRKEVPVLTFFGLSVAGIQAVKLFNRPTKALPAHPGGTAQPDQVAGFASAPETQALPQPSSLVSGLQAAATLSRMFN